MENRLMNIQTNKIVILLEIKSLSATKISRSKLSSTLFFELTVSIVLLMNQILC